LSVYRFRGKIKAANPHTLSKLPIRLTPDPPAQIKVSTQRKKRFVKDVKNVGESILNKFTAVFVVFLAVASVSLASAVNMLANILGNTPFIVAALAAFVVSSFFMCLMLRKFVLAYEEAVAKRRNVLMICK